MPQLRMNDLMRGQVGKFSLDALMSLAVAAETDLAWTATPRAA